MSATDDLLANARRNGERLAAGDTPAPPRRKVLVLTCMDARIDPAALLGLGSGDAHVVRNAGGVASSDALRSLTASQRLLGTEEVLVVQHTGCGMDGFDDDAFRRSLEEETGESPPWSVDAPAGTEADVRRSVERIRSLPFLPHTEAVRGFLYDVATGELREVH